MSTKIQNLKGVNVTRPKLKKMFSDFNESKIVK